MTKADSQKANATLQPPPSVGEEIERALEMIRRARNAQAAQPKQEIPETSGNTYVLPEPIVFRVSESS